MRSALNSPIDLQNAERLFVCRVNSARSMRRQGKFGEHKVGRSPLIGENSFGGPRPFHAPPGPTAATLFFVHFATFRHESVNATGGSGARLAFPPTKRAAALYTIYHTAKESV